MIGKIKKRIDGDFSGFVFQKLRNYRLLFLSLYSTKVSYMSLRLKGVKIASNCKFFGLPIVMRSMHSSISIAEGCRFRSDKSSNLIGLNRKCIVSTLKKGAKITIGKNSGFSGTVIGAANSITIGENVLSGANVLITDHDWHPIHPDKRHTSDGIENAPVVIENNVWLGVNSVILKGVTIGENTVIGANSLVVSDIPSNVIAGGSPCKVIKSLV